ncbi:MAG: hypothetical protein EOM15_17725 [Spirochaetia bacterium]|nr:hypothetical protein [Spirochaetia bacterium]
MTFDKNKVFTCVTGSTDLIGRKGWFADTLTHLAEEVSAQAPTELISFGAWDDFPFKGKRGLISAMFYPVPEQRYVPYTEKDIEKTGHTLIGRVLKTKDEEDPVFAQIM